MTAAKQQAITFQPDDHVAVFLPTTDGYGRPSRPLFGVVVQSEGEQVRVHLYSSRGEATIMVDAAVLKPWRRPATVARQRAASN